MDDDSSIRVADDVSVQMAFACESFSTDPFGRVTFHTILEQLTAPMFPLTTGMIFVIFGFRRVMPGFLMQCRVEILPEKGDPIAAQAIADIAFRPDQLTQRAVVGFGGVTWPSPGMYTVRFTSRGHTLTAFNLRALQMTPPNAQFPRPPSPG